MTQATLPREIAPGVWWFGDCAESRLYTNDVVHIHGSCYAVLGESATLMVDTGTPRAWRRVDRDLDAILDGRALDWIVPTHPELAHAGNLGRLLAKHPGALVAGDVRDYHVYYPQFESRLRWLEPGEGIDLGGGREFVILEALIKDLPNSQWGYDTVSRALFVADGFAYTHHPTLDEHPVHLPTECALLSSELEPPPDVQDAAFITRAALYWTRFVDLTSTFQQLESLLDRHPTELIAPAHGNVIVDVERLLAIIREAHRMAYAG